MTIKVAIYSLGIALVTYCFAAQAPSPSPVPTLMKAPEAFARLSDEEARETEAHTLGVQAVLWGLQWVVPNVHAATPGRRGAVAFR